MTGRTRAQQIAARVRNGSIPAGDWTSRIRDDIWQGTPQRCHRCRTPLHIVRGLTCRAIAAMCPHCDRAPGGGR